MRGDVVLFVHIPKTGGVSLLEVLKAEYGDGLYQIPTNRADPAGMAEFDDLADPRRDAIDVVSGHVAFGLHTRFARECRYITVMRDPVERALSQFFFLQARPHNPVHHLAVGHDPVSFMQARQMAMVDNLQTRMVAGGMAIGAQPFDRRVGPEDLDRAIANLARFAHIGFVESYAASMRQLSALLGWQSSDVPHRNVTPRTEPVTPAIRATIRAMEQYDIQLYAAARSQG